jgi:crotonobetainyl-CoA:carnitine CoA-transferase CaiB-like acyl-CoA transferase
MPDRVQRRAEMNALVAARFSERDSKHWAARLEEFRIPFAPVNDYAQALEDPQVAHRGLVREVEHPASGTIRVVGPPWRMSETKTEIASPPVLGQHNEQVLRDWLGIDRKECS